VAPKSHRVLFENAFVRVLEVIVAPGTTEPMHHHRWPSLFPVWDSGRADGAHSVLHCRRNRAGSSEQGDAYFRGQVARDLDGARADAFD
jgi:hypothetical protein